MNSLTVTPVPSPLPHPQHRPSIRSLADREAVRLARFLDKHPEYARLSPDVLLQYAETYRDDRDHALEQGCRADYGTRRAEDDPMPHPDGEAYYGRWEA
jgi:hypothetical protein